MPAKSKDHLICFDMDGVLIHSMSLANQIFYDTVEEQLGLPTQAFRQDKHLMALSAEERVGLLWKDEIEKRKIDPEAIESVMRLYRQRKLEANIQLLPHARQAVERMAQHFEFVAVVSSNPESIIRQTLERLELRPYFSLLVGIDHVAFTKPHPEMYLRAADHFGLAPQNALAFEDSTHGIASAKGAGMKVVGVATGLESIDELQRTPADRVWTDFSEMELETVRILLA